MRVSEHFGLDRQQPDIDFVDVDVVGDVAVFIDPRALRLLPTDWGSWCVYLLQDFFHTVLQAIRQGRAEDATRLLRTLREPNETHLGYSRGRARGRALGPDSAHDVSEALSTSVAVQSGLLEDLEDTILMVEGIRSDIVSDIATNVIREPLIRYTQDACETYGIPLVNSVASGPLWNPDRHEWHSRFERLPVVNHRRLLLVPKTIVRASMDYDQDEYYRHYLLEYLRDVELSANTELVYLLRDGTPRVDKKDVAEKYGEGKRAIVRLTRQHPEVLEHYRANKAAYVRPPLGHIELAEAAGGATPDWNALYTGVTQVAPGRSGADAYHKAIERLLTPLFYPSLSTPRIEFPIHRGRKRIDITYVNLAVQRFFAWLAANYPASHVFVECKNYASDPTNPELDQLAGRFSPSRGQFGLLLCRSFQNKDTFIERCRDTAMDGRGFIIPLDDGDLESLIDSDPDAREKKQFDLLKARFDRLIM